MLRKLPSKFNFRSLAASVTKKPATTDTSESNAHAEFTLFPNLPGAWPGMLALHFWTMPLLLVYLRYVRSSFVIIADDMVLLILSFLSTNDLSAFSLVSKACKRYAGWYSLWKECTRTYLCSTCASVSTTPQIAQVAHHLYGERARTHAHTHAHSHATLKCTHAEHESIWREKVLRLFWRKVKKGARKDGKGKNRRKRTTKGATDESRHMYSLLFVQSGEEVKGREGREGQENRRRTKLGEENGGEKEKRRETTRITERGREREEERSIFSSNFLFVPFPPLSVPPPPAFSSPLNLFYY